MPIFHLVVLSFNAYNIFYFLFCLDPNASKRKRKGFRMLLLLNSVCAVYIVVGLIS